MDSMRRYRDELAYLSADERRLVLLADELRNVLYRWESRTSLRPPPLPPYPGRTQPQEAELSN
jgi:hypothetical protein